MSIPGGRSTLMAEWRVPSKIIGFCKKRGVQWETLVVSWEITSQDKLFYLNTKANNKEQFPAVWQESKSCFLPIPQQLSCGSVSWSTVSMQVNSPSTGLAHWTAPSGLWVHSHPASFCRASKPRAYQSLHSLFHAPRVNGEGRLGQM
jgi:hypothetical protein